MAVQCSDVRMLGGSGLLQRREERLRVLGELQQVGQPVHQPGQLAGDVDPPPAASR